MEQVFNGRLFLIVLIKPTPFRNTAQSLHGQCIDINTLVNSLKLFRETFPLISSGTISHTFGPSNVILFVP